MVSSDTPTRAAVTVAAEFGKYYAGTGKYKYAE
jgi:hypothetical protein